jgi:hypothetical protein
MLLKSAFRTDFGIDVPRNRLSGFFEFLLSIRPLNAAPAATPISAVPPATRGVLALDAASATADRERPFPVPERLARLPLPFELLRFELGRFDGALLPEPRGRDPLPLAEVLRLPELFFFDEFLVCWAMELRFHECSSRRPLVTRCNEGQNRAARLA